MANANEQLADGNSPTSYTVMPHEKVLVVTPDCDLFNDFFHRFSPEIAELDETHERSRQSHLLGHILCCDVYEQEDLKPSIARGSDIWSRVERNQDERYQRIPGGQLAAQSGGEHPAFFLDFKRVFSLPTALLYGSLKTGQVKRGGVIPPPWIHSLADRLFYFQGRVCLPNPSDIRQLVRQPAFLSPSHLTTLPEPPIGA